MKIDNLSMYFDALRNNGFHFSKNDASMVIANNKPVKSKKSSPRTAIILMAFVALFAGSSYILLTIYNRSTTQQEFKNSVSDKISKSPSEALRSTNSSSPKMKPDQKGANVQPINNPSKSSRHITVSNSLLSDPLNNTEMPSFISMYSDVPENKHKENIPFTNDNSGDINTLIANSFIPQQKNYFSNNPSPLAANVEDGDFITPDISNWKMHIGSNSCSSAENTKQQNKLSKSNGEESLDSIKLMVCSHDELAQLGIHKTMSGVFIVLGDNLIACYNRHALYSKSGNADIVKAPMPALVTDEDGTRLRSYIINDRIINLIKDSSKKLTAIAKLDPLKVFMSTMNTLIPVLVRNDLDTSHGCYSSNIIAWYDPENMVFKGLIPDKLKNKMLNGNYGRATQSEQQASDASTIAVEKANKDMASGELTIWSDFKVYPNPVCIEFNFAFKLLDNKILKINLFDIHGRMVKILKPERLEAMGDLNYEFNISELPAGMYILAVESSTGELWTQRIIKQ